MVGCKIELEDPPDVYHPHETVKGTIDCTFSTETTVRGISVELLGEEKTKWQKLISPEFSEYRNVVRALECKGYNKVMSVKEEIMPGGQSFEIGSYTFPFSLTLPQWIPGTYESHRGTIKFFVKAHVDWGNQGSWTRKEFDVEAPADLHEVEPMYWGEYNTSVEKNYPSSCCLGDGLVTMDLYIPTRALVPGTRVKVAVDVTNHSDEKIERLECILGQTTKSVAITPEYDTKFDHKVLLVKKLEGLKDGPEKLYEFTVTIPETTKLPSFTCCKLFSQQYWIDVVAVTPHDLDIRITTWVVIGQLGSSTQRDEAMESTRQLSRQNSRTRNPLTSTNSRNRLLLPSSGPAPYSSYRQRPTGFAMARPITDPPAPTLTMPQPERPDQELSLPDVPSESPPTYEEAVRQFGTPVGVALAAAEAALSVAPSAPAESPEAGISSAPYPPDAVPSDSPEVSLSSAPYPPEAAPAACDSIGFTVSTSDARVEERPMPTAMPMPLPNNSAYPPPHVPSTFTSMPLPTPLFYPPDRPSTFTTMPMPSVAPYPIDPLSKWDMVRSAVPGMVASHRAGLYPPEMPQPTTSHVTPMPMPMPMLPSRDYRPTEADSELGSPSNSTPYPQADSPVVCSSIGFAVMNDDGSSTDDVTVRATEAGASSSVMRTSEV